MSGNARPSSRILGSLRSEDGVGVVRIEDRYDTSTSKPTTTSASGA